MVDHNSPPLAADPGATAESTCSICVEPCTQHSNNLHRDAVELLRPMLTLQSFLLAAPLDAFAFHFDPMDVRMQHNWLTKFASANSRRSSDTTPSATARSLVESVVAMFSIARFDPHRSTPSTQSTTDEAAYDSSAPAQPHASASSLLLSLDPTEQTQMVLRTCADLLLDALSSRRVHHLLVSAVLTTNNKASLDTIAACDRFCKFVRDLSDEVYKLFAARRSNNSEILSPRTAFDDRTASSGGLCVHNPISILVDDIMWLIYSHPNYKSLGAAVSPLQGSKLKTAVHQLFGVFVEQQRQHRTHEPQRRIVTNPYNGREGGGTSYGVASGSSVEHAAAVMQASVGPPQGAIRASPWNERWLLVPSSLYIAPVAAHASSNRERVSDLGIMYGIDAAPSLLTVVGVISTLSALDVVLEGSHRTIASAQRETTQGAPSFPATALVLDGRAHTFGLLPSGLLPQASAALFGPAWKVADVKGRLLGQGSSIELLLFLLPASCANQSSGNVSGTVGNQVLAARQTRLRIALGSAQSILSVFAEVSAIQHPGTCVRSSNSESTEKAIERLRNLQWFVTLELHAMYTNAAGGGYSTLCH